MPGFVRIGRLRFPLLLFAGTLSGAVHAGLLCTAYFAAWTPLPDRKPRIEFERGRHAVHVTILTDPVPEPIEPVEPPVERPEAPIREDSRPIEPPPPAEPPPLFDTPLLDEVFTEVGPVQEALEPPPEPPAAEPVKPIEDEPPEEDAPPPPELLPAPVPDDPEEPSAQEPSAQEPSAEERPVEEPPPPSPVPPDTPQPPPPEPPDAETPRQQPDESAAPDEEGVETGIAIAHLPKPRYPLVSRRLGEEGVVVLRVEVLANGKVGTITVLEDPGYPRLTQAAVEAVKKARFQPATRNGKPVRDVVRIPFRFTLR